MNEGATYAIPAAEEALARAAGVVPCMGEFAVGSVVAGKYLVQLAVAEGAVGSVVKAKHLGLEQPVAIKYVRPLAVWIPGVVERFLREARLAARIRSDHAVRVYDVDTVQSGTPYMVMEYLEGRDLRVLLDDGPLEIERAVDYVLQAVEGLAEAHAVGIIHRDLKPENLFLVMRPDGSSIVKVLDFGISKLGRGLEHHAKRGRAGPAVAHEVSRLADKRVTNPADSFGTPSFMSPEQIESSADVDARTDVWSLGVVLYELITGALPFAGDSVTRLWNAILSHPPMLLRLMRPDAPPELAAVVHRCLEKDRAKRYGNVGMLARALAPFGSPESASRLERIARVLGHDGDWFRVSATPRAEAPRCLEIVSSATTVRRAARPRALALARKATLNRRSVAFALGCLPLLGGAMLATRVRQRPWLEAHVSGASLQRYAAAAIAVHPVLRPTVSEPANEFGELFLAAPVILAPEATAAVPAQAARTHLPRLRSVRRADPAPPPEPVAEESIQRVNEEGLIDLPYAL